jgi:phosphatidylserine/phosphatidylglycerophosphate/cardiolipin synthase-like enzyme
MGGVFAEALAERARAGCSVNILLDALGCANIGEEILAVLERGGCHVAWFNPLRWYTLGRFNNRTHRKSLIIDGEVAFTGGAGIADHWRGNATGPDHWRDMQIRLEGPAVVPFTGWVRAVPDPVAIETLIEAKQRGGGVRIMVSGIRNDNWLARHDSVRLFGRLLAAGIEIQEFNRTMLHHKTMVGGWPLGHRSGQRISTIEHNDESNVCVFDRALVEELHATFLHALDGCGPLTIERWQTRGAWPRVQEFVAAFLQEQA